MLFAVDDTAHGMGESYIRTDIDPGNWMAAGAKAISLVIGFKPAFRASRGSRVLTDPHRVRVTNVPDGHHTMVCSPHPYLTVYFVP